MAGTAEAKTTYGIIGIKVWVFKGEAVGKGELPSATPEQAEEPAKKSRKLSSRPAKPDSEGDASPASATARRPATEKSADAATKTPVKRVRKAAPAADAATKEGKE